MCGLLEFFPEGFLINIVDIGAALSERPSYQGIVNAGRGRIIGFEPDAAECRRLSERYGAPHQFFPHFVGDGNPCVFHETNWNLTGSLLEPNHGLTRSFGNLDELLQPEAQHAVSTSWLDDIQGIDDVDFIKVDIQGAELMVFRNAPRIMAQTLMIQTEVEFVEIYKGRPLFADVDGFLRQSALPVPYIHWIWHARLQTHDEIGRSQRRLQPGAVVGCHLRARLVALRCAGDAEAEEACRPAA